eukprot:g398.t1
MQACATPRSQGGDRKRRGKRSKKKPLTPSNGTGGAYTPRKPTGTPSSLRSHSKKYTPKRYTPSNRLQEDENDVIGVEALPFGGKMISFDDENLHPNAQKARNSATKLVPTPRGDRVNMPPSISDSLPSLGSRQKGGMYGRQRPTSSPSALPGGRRRSNDKNVSRTPNALGIETTISELDLGSHSDEEAVDGQAELKVLSIDDIRVGSGKPHVNHPAAVKKKTTTSAFLARQRLKGLTSSPADNTFSPVTRQFLRRDASNGIMKKTNIQRVIAERRLSGCNGGAGSSKQQHRHSQNSVHTASPVVTTKHKLGSVTTTTPRQLPSLAKVNAGNIAKGGLGKYASPSDLLLSPASKAFTTGIVGATGKYQGGNVQKLIALNKYGKPKVPLGKRNIMSKK